MKKKCSKCNGDGYIYGYWLGKPAGAQCSQCNGTGWEETGYPESQNRDTAESLLEEARDKVRVGTDLLIQVAQAIPGSSTKMTDNFEAAIRAADRGLAMASKASHQTLLNLWSVKASALKFLQRWQEANSAYDKAVSYGELSFFSWCWKAECLYYLRRYAEGMAALDRALLADPSDPMHTVEAYRDNFNRALGR